MIHLVLYIIHNNNTSVHSNIYFFTIMNNNIKILKAGQTVEKVISIKGLPIKVEGE